MAWQNAAYPTGWVTVTSAKLSRLFLDTDPLTFNLSANTAETYEVRNYYGDVVASGAIPAPRTSLTIPPLPRGWYKLYLRRAATDATYGTLIGLSLFSVLAPDARLPDPPPHGTTTGGGYQFEGRDHVVRGIAMLGPERNQAQAADNAGTRAAQIAAVRAELPYLHDWYDGFQPDAARPRPRFMQFPNGGYQSAAHTDGVTAMVAALYGDGITHYEGPTNEPDIRAGSAAALPGQMQTFYNAVKAGNAAAKVMGPCPVTIIGGVKVDATLAGLDAFLARGGGQYIDALSFHAYNGVNGDITLGRRTMDGLMRVLAAYGLSGIELWQTEWGQFAATYGVFTPRRQARWWVMHRFIMDQYGVPKERDYWFYDTSHGFWNFPSMWKLSDGCLTALIPVARTYAAEIHGKTWTARLDFGTVENAHYIGSRFTDPDDGAAMLALLSGGRTDGAVRLHVTGATSVVRVDCFGNTATIACDAQGIAAIPVTLEPCYVRLPPGVNATVEQVAYGPNVAREGTRNAGAGTVDARDVTNGRLENFYYAGPSELTEYRDDALLPATLTVELYHEGDNALRARRIDTVVVHCPTPWQNQSSLLDFDVEYRDRTGAWHVLDTITEPAKTFAALSNQQHAGSYFDSFHSGRCVFVSTFEPVMAEALRLTVRDATAGGEATEAAVAAGGGSGQGNSQRHITVREIAAYCRATQAPEYA